MVKDVRRDVLDWNGNDRGIVHQIETRRLKGRYTGLCRAGRQAELQADRGSVAVQQALYDEWIY